MSNLLERAIVDATALKEAALKSAEKLVIEKYSQEVKTAVDKLLEGHFEETDTVNEQDLGAAAPSADPFGFDALESDPGAGLGDEPQPDPTLGAEQEEQEPLDREDILANVPDAFNSDEDEIIRIKLDSLEAELEDELDGPFASGDEFGDDEIGIDIQGVQDDFDDEEIGLDLDDEFGGDFDNQEIGIDITEDNREEIERMMSEVLEDLEIDENEVEIDLDELMERVRVDFEPQKSGWAGTPESIMREYESMLLAREQDSEVKEENEELRKTVKALKQENKTLSSAATKLQTQTEKYETAFNSLQEKLETMNVSNAKLLYINQALENASLNERQKRKIVEAISKAETVQEAKIVFETMNEAVATNLDVKKEATLNEVVSNRSTLLVAARKEQKNTNANPIYNRLQKLAGIKT